MAEFQEITSRIDSVQLSKIKNQFALRDRINSDRFEISKIEKENPSVLFDSTSSPSSITESTLQSLKYPLELDGNGGLKLSSGYARLGEQILEVLETMLGERVYRPFFGIPEVLFETINENLLSQSIRSQLLAFLPVLSNIQVRANLYEDGRADIIVVYSVEGSEDAMVNYSFSV